MEEEFFRASEQYGEILMEIRQLVYERMGTPEKPREPSVATVEFLLALARRAKGAYDRMVEIHSKLRG